MRSTDLARFLTDDAAIAAYLSDLLEGGDPGLLAAALGDIARARGMTEIAGAAGVTREALYKALRPDAQPRFDTVQRVCTALGLRLVALPIGSAPNRPTECGRTTSVLNNAHAAMHGLDPP